MRKSVVFGVLVFNGKYVSGDDNKRCSDGSYVGIHERCS